ncbi:hypothetical protein IC621_00080 [Bacillus sp. IB182487]|uniref:CheR-type methyltransferase domain-containing protein n=1 Tax=Metabacillus arenae TaxID=2771434 RepID=A0A926NI81_9BACI|nr:CheR family methyltransferase [Metabacillus arenae]MBD1378612.1 hypothetical protein [Metabacillus arenae]
MLEVPAESKQKYFIMEKGKLHKVDDRIKNSVEFKRHNLLADPFETQCDLIICRNVLIYFTEQAKDQTYYNFSRA